MNDSNTRSIIIIMSVDVFGRQLGKTESDRSSPGIGYKLTNDGNFDLESRRLCNVASPSELADAINLGTVQSIIELELEKVNFVTAELRKDLKNLVDKVDLHRDELDIAIENLMSEIMARKKEIKDLKDK